MTRRALLLTLFAAAAACGYVLDIYWVQRFDPLGAKLGLEISRHDAISAARQFAATRDQILRTQAYVKLEGDDDLERFFPAAGVNRTTRSAIEEWTPVVSYLVVLMDPQWKNRLEVRISKAGRVLGFNQLDVEDGQNADDAPARALAESAFGRRFGSQNTTFQYDGVKSVERPSRRTRVFQWSRQAASNLAIDASVEVAGSRVVAEEVRPRIDPQFKQQHIKSAGKANTFLGILIWIVALTVAVYAMFRYVVRVREQEVPHARALLLLAVLLGAAISGLLVFSDDALMDSLRMQSDRPEGKFSAAMPIAIALGMFALAMAIAWAGCEGDLRERFPGKLTSFDALLGGRIASANVALAFLSASGWAGVSLLMQRSIAFGMPNPAIGTTFQEGTVMAARVPVLASLVSYPLMSAIVAVLMGMMVPVSMLRRWKTTSARLGFVIFLILYVFVAATVTRTVPGVWAFALAAAGAGMLTIPFLLHDLLTSLLTLSIGSSYLFAIRMVSQPNQDLRTNGITLLAVLVIALAAALTRAFKAPLRDSDVRPLYAKNLLERQELQAELSAARHAQQRLLPLRFPEIAGASVTARCEPSSDVSGDYYDVLKLSDGRLLFVMVDESVEGLSAALRVTLIKGLLLSYVRRHLSATELVRRVTLRVQEILRDERPLSIAIALFDPTTREVELARSGQTPHIFITSAVPESGQASAVTSASLPREVLLHASGEIAESGFTLEKGEVLMLLSDAFDEARVKQLTLRGGDQHLDALFREQRDKHGVTAASGDRTALVLATERV